MFEPRRRWPLVLRRIVVAAFVLVFLVVGGPNLYILLTTWSRVLDVAEVPFDARTGGTHRKVALVLGAQVRSDGPSRLLEDRLVAAQTLYINGVVQKLLLSGAAADHYDEAKTMRRFLVDRGVPDAALVVDRTGFRTLDSVHRARSVYGLTSLIIVTNEFHLPRALFLADRFGIDAIGVSHDRPQSLVPLAKNLGRETLARVLAVLDVVVLGTRAEVLGPPIPLDEDAT
jgi:SanA protein